MCLAIPVKIVEVNGAEAVVELDGIRRRANVAMIDRPQPGDYVLLHAGFAIEKWTAEQAAEVYALWREMEAAGEEGRPEGLGGLEP